MSIPKIVAIFSSVSLIFTNFVIFVSSSHFLSAMAYGGVRCLYLII